MKIEKIRYQLNTQVFNIPQYDQDNENLSSSFTQFTLILAITLTILISLFALYPKNPFTDPYWLLIFGLTIATWIYYYLCATAPKIFFTFNNAKIHSGDEVRCQIEVIGNPSAFKSITLTLMQRVSIRAATYNGYISRGTGYITKYPYSEKIVETKNAHEIIGTDITFNIPKQLHPTFKSNVHTPTLGKGNLDLSKAGDFYIEWILTACCKLKNRPTLYLNEFITVHTLNDEHENENHNQIECF